MDVAEYLHKKNNDYIRLKNRTCIKHTHTVYDVAILQSWVKKKEKSSNILNNHLLFMLTHLFFGEYAVCVRVFFYYFFVAASSIRPKFV